MSKQQAEGIAVDMVLDFLDTFTAGYIRDYMHDYRPGTSEDDVKEVQRKAEGFVKALRGAMEIWYKHVQQRQELIAYANNISASLKA